MAINKNNNRNSSEFAFMSKNYKIELYKNWITNYLSKDINIHL